MGSRVSSRVLNVMAMWSNSSVSEMPSPLTEKKRWGLSTSNFVNMLRSTQQEVEVDVFVIVQNIGRDCFWITQKVEEDDSTGTSFFDEEEEGETCLLR